MTPDQPSSADIRQFLFDAFSDEELETLCFDYFPVVHSDFTTGLTKTQKIQRLLEYCRQYEMLPNLLVAIQKMRPAQYEQQFPRVAEPKVYPELTKPIRDFKQVFICHAHEDVKFAHRLAGDLRQHSWRVWIAPDSIRPGEKWVEAIQRGLDESGVFIALLTPDMLKSRWAMSETSAAIALENEGKMRLLPLEAKRCQVPTLLSRYQRVPIIQDYESGLAALLAALGDKGNGGGENRPHRILWPWAIGAGIALVLIVVGAILSRSLNARPVYPTGIPTQVALSASPVPPTPSSTSIPILVTVLSPSQDGEVSHKARIRGVARGIPADRRLWVLVQSYGGDGYYPQEGPIKVDAEGNWEIMAYVGKNKKTESTKPFTLTIALADEAASQRLASFWQTSPISRGLDILPQGTEVYRIIRVTRNNPIVELHSHVENAKVQGYEEMNGAYDHLEPGIWQLYGIVEARQGQFTPFGPFVPKAEKGEWAIPVKFPWPAENNRKVTFYALAVLAGTEADKRLDRAVKSAQQLTPRDLTDKDWLDVYEPLVRTTLTRAERIAFTSDRPGNDDIFIINSDGTGLKRLTNDPGLDTDPTWSPDATRVGFTSEREGKVQLYIMDASGQNVHRVLTDTAMRAGAPNWSPDGQWIAFHSDKNGDYDIYKVHPDGTGLTQLTKTPKSDVEPVWSPDSSRILFLSDRAQDTDGHSELYVMNADGSNVTRLTRNKADEGHADWSPDGQHILFISEFRGDRDIYLMGADGTNITPQPSQDYDNDPSFAPDGQRYVFASSVNRIQLFLARLGGDQSTQIQKDLARIWSPEWSPRESDERIVFVGRYDGDWEIYTMWDDGTDPVQLTNNTWNDVQPRMSPDGRCIAYASNEAGNYDIWVADATLPLSKTQLTKDLAWDERPAWSPDSKKLAFASDRDGNTDIFVINADGSGVVRLTSDPAEDNYPSWSPDGKHIVFYSKRTGDGDIYVMDADGQNVIPLVTNPGFDWSPAWSPSGRTIAFASARGQSGAYHTEVYALDFYSKTLVRLTDSLGPDDQPVWSGDERRIFFDSARRWGISDVWVMDADGSHVSLLTDDERNRSDILGGP